MKIFTLTAALVISMCALTASGQDLNKPYTEWSERNAQKIATQSGWAKTYTSIEGLAAAEADNVRREQAQTANRGGGNPGSVSRAGGNPPIVIRLHSAPVVRQAMVRLQQIQVKYDKMSDAEKAQFDESRKVFLDCAICKDYYVVTVTKYTDASGQSVDDGMFQALTLEDLKGHIKLVNDKGEERELFQFTPSKGGSDAAVLFFKRLDDSGNALVRPEVKDIEFVVSNDFKSRDRRYGPLLPRKFEFSVKKMMVGDDVQF